MRPKLFSLLAVSALALVGCSAEEPAKPAPTTAPASVIPEIESTPTPTLTPQDEYLEAVNAELAGKIDDLKKEVPAKKLTEKYWVKAGKEYCVEIEDGDPQFPIFKNGTEQALERVFFAQAFNHLCPSS